MAFWTDVHPAIFVTVFLVFPIGFNLLNVRRYGEIEYWFTTIKVLTIVGLVLAGLLIAMGAAPGPNLLGTDANFKPVDCINNNNPLNAPCVPGFGFISISPMV
jgi:amino acid permease